jgi:eukaryotic-like serine/threonine-protein kinase
MGKVDDDRELLYGVTALRLGLVSRDGLDGAFTAWKGTRDRPLTRTLIDRGMLRADQLATLEAEVAAALRSHRGHARLALAAAGPVGSELRKLLAEDVSFDTLGAEDAEGGPDARPHTGQNTVADVKGSTASAAHVIDRGETTEAIPAQDLYATLSETATKTKTETDQTQVTATHRTSPGAESTIDLETSSKAPSSRPDHATDADVSGLRYRILRLHAKGGLGQVFVARDEELNREVALKEIQGKHADHDESRLRFLIEAEVTGNLEHPGIVPVYGLGRYPDGRPYYAMRFVRGESLKESLDRFHTADPHSPDHGLQLRKLLGQLVDVCNAMAYAHSRGVLHRDLKPGNIMLGAFGETLVVDWGLAKFKDVPEAKTNSSTGLLRPMSAGSSSATLYGSAVGTPQYMSPEQAAGQLEELGPASDIYSLGTILYVILAGKSPFEERQLSVLLDRVRKGDFSPPRKVGRNVPPALNAICLKAMAQRSQDRYPSARALADDIEHWMADEPVSVYREPILARLARWARRHKTAVASAAALLITALVSLGVYSVLIKREQARTERFYGLARAAVEKFLTKLGEDDLADVPQMEPVRNDMLQEAKTFYETFLRERTGDPRARRDVALSGVRLGDIETLLGHLPKAEVRYNDAIGHLNALLKERPKDRDLRNDLSRALHSRGLLFRKQSRSGEAERDFKDAIDLRQALADEFPAEPNYQRARADSLYHLAALHMLLGDNVKARREYQDVIGVLEKLAAGPSGTIEDRRLLARYTNNLANLLLNEKGDGPKEAKAGYQKALAIQQQVHDEKPAVAIYRSELAKTHGNLRFVLAGENKLKEAESHAREDLALSRKLATDFKRTPDYRWKLAAAEISLGELRVGMRQFDEEAGKLLDDAVALAEGLVKEHGDQRSYLSVLAQARLNRGVLLGETKHLQEAEDDLREACDTLRPLVKAKAVPEDAFDFARALYDLGDVRAKLGRNDLAFADQGEAIKLADGLVAARPDRRDYRFLLASALIKRGMIQGTAEPKDAESDFLRACDLLKPLTESPNPFPDDALAIGTAFYELARLQGRTTRFDEALRNVDQANRYHALAGALGTSASGEVPPLWRDDDLKAGLLQLGKPTEPIEYAETVERLPTLRPDDRGSYIRAARGLARCTFPGIFGKDVDDATAQRLTREYADRALKVLAAAAGRGLLKPADLDDPFYANLKGRDDFQQLQKTVAQPAKPKG